MLNSAVSGRRVIIEIIASDKFLFSWSSAHVDGHSVLGHVQQARCVTFADLLQAQKLSRVSLSTLDCEGAEHEIIAGLASDVCTGIEAIVTEFHEVAGYDVAQNNQRLMGRGYGPGAERTHLFVGNILSPEDYAQQRP